MKKYIYVSIAFASVLQIISCSGTLTEQGETGYLGISLLKDSEVFVKSVEAPAEDMVFSIAVYKGEELVASADDHRTVTADNPLELAAGTYRILASSGDSSAEAAFDSPLYAGETDVTVFPERMNRAEVVAALSNVMVTVSFDSSLTGMFAAYSVVVCNSSGKGLTFSSDNGNLDRTGYVRADGTLSWTLTLEDSDGETYTKTVTYSGVKAQQHYALRFAIADDAGDAGYGAFRLIVDDSMSEKEYDIQIDFSDDVRIETGDGFELAAHNYYHEGDNASKVFAFTAEKGIRSLAVMGTEETLARESVSYELVDASAETIGMLAEKGIRVSSVAYGAVTAYADVTDFVASLPAGTYSLTFCLYDTMDKMAKTDFVFTVVADACVEIGSAAPWAKFAVVDGRWTSDKVPDGMTFSYRKASDEFWTDVPESALELDEDAGTYSAVIRPLVPETLYYVKAVSSYGRETDCIEFRTESAGVISNMGFDDWWQNGKVWYPYVQNASEKVWDSANKATGDFKGSLTTPEESIVVSGKAAKLVSAYAVIAFAAGNIYTGQFNRIDGMGADLDWGTPFASRPLALKGHYNYKPAVINRTKAPYDSCKGKMDKCQIQILLTDWDAPFNVNTSNGKFVDFENDEHIIAYAKYESGDATDGYREFTLPLVYRSHRRPKYIVITCCASYLGDYFTGGEGSTLYVDEFSFEYDPANLSPEEEAQVNYR